MGVDMAAPVVVDRAQVRRELEATRPRFTGCWQRRSRRWHAKSATCAWTVGEVLVHLTWALEYLPQEVARARQGKGMFNLPEWLAAPASFWIIRRQARKCDPATLARRYDAAMAATLAALATVPDSDWGLGALLRPRLLHGGGPVSDARPAPGGAHEAPVSDRACRGLQPGFRGCPPAGYARSARSLRTTT